MSAVILHQWNILLPLNNLQLKIQRGPLARSSIYRALDCMLSDVQ